MLKQFYTTMRSAVIDELRCCGCIVTIGFAGVLASGAVGVGTVLVLS